MKHSTRLADLLQSTFDLHRARLTCLAALVIALFRVKTVNLAQLATAFPGTAEIDSHYRRLQRFFQYLHLQPARVATFVLAFLPDAPYTLALDRTQWMLGRVCQRREEKSHFWHDKMSHFRRVKVSLFRHDRDSNVGSYPSAALLSSSFIGALRTPALRLVLSR